MPSFNKIVWVEEDHTSHPHPLTAHPFQSITFAFGRRDLFKVEVHCSELTFLQKLERIALGANQITLLSLKLWFLQDYSCLTLLYSLSSNNQLN
jgi:hypothetical protein